LLFVILSVAKDLIAPEDIPITTLNRA